jgi:hypothetical protein
MVSDPYCDVSVAAIMANRDQGGCDESHETREAANRGGLACSGIQRCNPRHSSRALIFSVMTVTANDRPANLHHQNRLMTRTKEAASIGGLIDYA